MKNRRKCLLICFFIFATVALCLCGCSKVIPHSEYIRLHIRADSNDECDQEIKLKVRDAVVSYLTIRSKTVKDRWEMRQLLLSDLQNVERVANEVLVENGVDYVSRAKLCVEEFPEKSYGDLTLEAGEYEALIIELGSGKGNNWWCVAYPPLCFIAAEDVEGDEVEYRSVIADFFKSLK